jgi:hypothetical protein
MTLLRFCELLVDLAHATLVVLAERLRTTTISTLDRQASLCSEQGG